MSQDLFIQIKKAYPSFSKGQKAISDYLLEHYEKAAFMTAAKIGQAVGVSESTVVRFVTELGFSGYHELKRALQQQIKNRLTALQRMQITEERIRESGVPAGVLAGDMLNISETLSQLDPAAFDKAVKEIVAAKNVYIVGVRNAGMLSDFLSFNLGIVMDNVRRVDASGASELLEQIVRIGKGDLMIGISFPRYSKRTVAALNFARGQGAKVIAVTDSSASPLAPFADLLLLARSDMASFVDSLVAPMSLINALIVGVAREKGGETEAALRRLEQVWQEYGTYDTDGGNGNG